MSVDPGRARALPRAGLWLLVGLLIALGVLLRLRYLDESTLFIDEGESCINALSILEHGQPVDHYLGLPLFENTLTEPWPGHPEYEFRDTSYSSKGLAIYHGWLPLYAIAASFWLHGIEPDRVDGPPAVKHDRESLRQRIRAARLPSVLFGALFLLAIFLAGRSMGGEGAGLAALTLAVFEPKCVWIAQQARYYSAALALSTLCLWLLWRLAQRGRIRDHALAALALVLLFHTSSLAFAILVATGSVLLPRLLRHARWKAGFLCAAAILLAGILPWMAWSGFFQHSQRVPMAREHLSFANYFQYLDGMRGLFAAGVAGLTVFAFAWSLRRHLPGRLREAVEAVAAPTGLLVVWLVTAYLGFQLLVPAASCSMGRLSHNLLAGSILLGALALAALGRLVLPARPGALAVLGALALLIGSGHFLRWQRRNPRETEAVLELVEALRVHDFRPDTRIYSLPYQHFCLSFYTGLPVQSIAPVRRDFLDGQRGEILILETANRVPPPQAESIQRAAREQGVELGLHEARAWADALMQAMIRAEVEPLVARFEPGAPALPDWTSSAAETLLRDSSDSPHGRFDYSLDNPAMFESPALLAIDEFWPRFFYCFVEPGKRTGAGLNYAWRLEHAEARLLVSKWLWLRIPARDEVRHD